MVVVDLAVEDDDFADQEDVEEEDDACVEPSGFVEGDGGEGDECCEDGVDQHLMQGALVAKYCRRHGDAYGGILILDEEGQGPEVYGRPEEYEEEQQDCHPVEAVGDRGPAQ